MDFQPIWSPQLVRYLGISSLSSYFNRKNPSIFPLELTILFLLQTDSELHLPGANLWGSQSYSIPLWNFLPCSYFPGSAWLLSTHTPPAFWRLQCLPVPGHGSGNIPTIGDGLTHPVGFGAFGRSVTLFPPVVIFLFSFPVLRSQQRSIFKEVEQQQAPVCRCREKGTSW